MSIIVFYLEDNIPNAVEFGEKEMSQAIQEINALRAKPNVNHVCMSSELSGMVGKLGVDSIKDGKTPDGLPYEWSKAGRAGKMRRHDAGTQIQRTDANS